MPNNIKALLFDLGGVLVRLEASEKLKGSLDKAEFDRRRLASHSIALFETGKISTGEFARSLVSELELDLSPEELLNEYKNYTKETFPETIELLRYIPVKYISAIFSNTSSLHWESLSERYNIDGFFDRHFLSYKMGLLKPDREIYLRVIQSLNLKPEEIAFFDDSPANIAAATELGINAYLVKEARGLKTKLKELEVI